MIKPLSLEQVFVEYLQYINYLNEHWDKTTGKAIFVLDKFDIWTEKPYYKH